MERVPPFGIIIQHEIITTLKIKKTLAVAVAAVTMMMAAAVTTMAASFFFSFIQHIYMKSLSLSSLFLAQINSWVK